VDEELFNRVQRIVDAHAGNGTRERKHLHFLKGLVWCGRCNHRSTIIPARGNGGEYFTSCAGDANRSSATSRTFRST
jgi:hypothetical protein